jgi:cell division FtsZ-interacting protein ZapD
MAYVVPVAQSMKVPGNGRRLDQPHYFAVLRIDSNARENKVNIWILGCYQLRRANKIRVIFHWIEASD